MNPALSFWDTKLRIDHSGLSVRFHPTQHIYMVGMERGPVFDVRASFDSLVELGEWLVNNAR